MNLACENLILGHNVIIDTVNPLHISRAMFQALKDRTHSETIQFELKIKDSSIHKSRVETRTSDMAGLKIPGWKDVLKRSYDKWDNGIDGNRYEIWTDDLETAFNNCLSIIAEKWGMQ